MRSRSIPLAFAALLSLVLACSTTPLPTDASSDAAAVDAGNCDALANSARDEVHQAISDHLACAADEDCTTIELSATCFDSCSRAVNGDGLADVQAAKAHVDDAQCKQFIEQNCRFDIPPCLPPMTPRCISGQCQDQL